MGSADASSSVFSWSLEVRFGGVFPLGGIVASVTDCYVMGQKGNMHTSVDLYVMPDGFARDVLDPGNLFVPFDGQAKLDHATATASLEAIESDGGAPAVTVSVTDGQEPTSTLHGLRVDDAFDWSDHRATIVRIVPPESGMFGAMGWVEVSLSSRASSRSAPNQVAGERRHAG